MGRNANAGVAAAAVGTIDSATAAALGQITPLVAAENFAAGDLVFSDIKQNTYHRLLGAPPTLALAAGPAAMAYTHQLASAQQSAAASVTLPNGDTVVATCAITTAGNQYTISVARYSPRGVQLARYDVEPTTGSVLSNLMLTVLSNGNIALGYIRNAAGRFVILSPSMQPIASGNPNGTSQGLIYLQETNNGGFIIVHSTGFTFVSATGVQTQLYTGDVNNLARQADLNDDQAALYNPRCHVVENLAPVPLSNGGFGFFFCKGGLGVSLLQANADGTLRTPVASLLAIGAQGINGLRVGLAGQPGAGGNIAWAVQLANNVGYYGIVSDAGNIVLGATADGTLLGPGGSEMKVLADAVGGFVFIANISAGGYAIHYTSGTGVAKAGFPKNLLPSGGGNAKAVRTPTGTVFVHSSTSAATEGTFISLSGVITTSTLWNFGNGVAGIHALLVHAGVAYGATSVSEGNANLAVFSVSDAGVFDAVPVYTAVMVAYNSEMRVGRDTAGKQLIVVYKGVAVTFTLDAAKSKIQTYFNPSISGNTKVRFTPFGFQQCDQTNGNYASACLLVKYQNTVLRGVAAAAAAAGGALTVNTRGDFVTTYANYAGTFDHSASNPPGAKGFIDSGYLRLNGN
ncbi:hypothetical protein [uncultured Xylophilus sp.]|uniref:hypothetical protein n=1 Tax=uncultured Xylophilus sp. TaxID=296832 RepID=UPI0025F4DD31|nr:hypothetical protein [uncultured Xylophilus sp.]